MAAPGKVAAPALGMVTAPQMVAAPGMVVVFGMVEGRIPCPWAYREGEHRNPMWVGAGR